ncbi:MAG TPA: hypothetical protein VF523_01215, partial [Burkholderiales bacterium]
MERRKAMRFRIHIASPAVPEAKRDICASRRSMPLIFRGANEAGLARTRGANRKAHLARGARAIAHVFRWREWGKPHTRMLFEN